MFDPLTLLVAKAKAVGLVAGTALVTTAVVGGGTVALTAVNSEAPLTSTVSASPSPDSGLASLTAAATPTATISPSPTSVVVPQVDANADGLDDASGLPMGFVCDDSKNHGQNVSRYAQSLPKGPGRGPLVSAVAKSDCGKGAAEAEASTTASPEPSKTPKAAKAAKPAKPAKAVKPAKAAKPQKTAKQKPARSGKPEGKGGKGGSGKD